MITRPIAPVVFIFSFLITAFSGMEKVPNRLHNMLEQQLEGGLINVANFAYTDQNNAAAAYSRSSNQYLVVYEDSSNQGDILGQFIDAGNGDLEGSWFYIANSAGEEFNPAVVYDPFKDRFLVVWSQNYCLGGFCYFVIQGRLVYGSEQNGSNFPGAEFTLASEHQPNNSGYDLVAPATAYNKIDHQFIVVYLKGKKSTDTFKSIYGQLLSSDELSPDVLSGVFEGFDISTTTTSAIYSFPSAAWSPHGGTFLVIWGQFWPTNLQVDQVLSRYVIDTYQGSGKKQVQGSGPHHVADKSVLGDDPLVDHYTNPSVAYDPQNKVFVVVFTYFKNQGANSSRVIYGQRMKSAHPDVGNPTYEYSLDIETSIDANTVSHYIPEIAYSGVRDEMYVVYLTEYHQKGDVFYLINQRTLRGKFANPTLEIRRSAANGYLEDPVAAGTNDGRALVVWDEEYHEAPHDYDVNAQRIKAFSKVYLPNVVR